MNYRLLLIPAIVAVAAVSGSPQSALCEPNDAQSQAAALLSGQRAPGKLQASERAAASRSRASEDAQASAVALLTGRSASGQPKTLVQVKLPNTERKVADAHTQAAALLSGSRIRGEGAKRRPSPAAAASGE